jgi:hypothetical protein
MLMVMTIMVVTKIKLSTMIVMIIVEARMLFRVDNDLEFIFRRIFTCFLFQMKSNLGSPT